MRAASVTAADEQRWNEASLAQPVETPAWRLWVYREPAVVLGCSQRRLLDGGVRPNDLELVVRSAGGGAVLVGPWLLGLSAALPAAHPLVGGGLVASYCWLGEAIASALQQVGIAAAAQSPEALRLRRDAAAATMPAPASRPDWACFGSLSPWEVLVGDRKIAGLAQVRRRHGVLLVAGVLLQDPPWALLCDRLGQPREDALRLARATTSCSAARTEAPPAALAVAVTQALARALWAVLDPVVGSPALEAPRR